MVAATMPRRALKTAVDARFPRRPYPAPADRVVQTRVVVDFQTGNFAVVIARADKPRPEIDVLAEVEEMLADGKQTGAAA